MQTSNVNYTDVKYDICNFGGVIIDAAIRIHSIVHQQQYLISDDIGNVLELVSMDKLINLNISLLYSSINYELLLRNPQLDNKKNFRHEMCTHITVPHPLIISYHDIYSLSFYALPLYDHLPQILSEMSPLSSIPHHYRARPVALYMPMIPSQ